MTEGNVLQNNFHIASIASPNEKAILFCSRSSNLLSALIRRFCTISPLIYVQLGSSCELSHSTASQRPNKEGIFFTRTLPNIAEHCRRLVPRERTPAQIIKVFELCIIEVVHVGFGEITVLLFVINKHTDMVIGIKLAKLLGILFCYPYIYWQLNECYE